MRRRLIHEGRADGGLKERKRDVMKGRYRFEVSADGEAAYVRLPTYPEDPPPGWKLSTVQLIVDRGDGGLPRTGSDLRLQSGWSLGRNRNTARPQGSGA